MKIHEHGYWIGPTNGEHCFDAPLADALVKRLHGHLVLDIGCGVGDYVSALQHAGIKAIGFDGNPATPYLSNWRCHVADLALPWDLPHVVAWDTVLCLEVMEHIPANYEDAALNNLIDRGRKQIILSWARPGQSGSGHVNCRSPEYVEARMAGFDFAMDRSATDALRAAATLPWFRTNLFVFNRC